MLDSVALTKNLQLLQSPHFGHSCLKLVLELVTGREDDSDVQNKPLLTADSKLC